MNAPFRETRAHPPTSACRGRTRPAAATASIQSTARVARTAPPRRTRRPSTRRAGRASRWGRRPAPTRRSAQQNSSHTRAPRPRRPRAATGAARRSRGGPGPGVPVRSTPAVRRSMARAPRRSGAGSAGRSSPRRVSCRDRASETRRCDPTHRACTCARSTRRWYRAAFRGGPVSYYIRRDPSTLHHGGKEDTETTPTPACSAGSTPSNRSAISVISALLVVSARSLPSLTLANPNLTQDTIVLPPFRLHPDMQVQKHLRREEPLEFLPRRGPDLLDHRTGPADDNRLLRLPIDHNGAEQAEDAVRFGGLLEPVDHDCA